MSPSTTFKHLALDKSWNGRHDKGFDLLTKMSEPEQFGEETEDIGNMSNCVYDLFFNMQRKPTERSTQYVPRFRETYRNKIRNRAGAEGARISDADQLRAG